MATFFINTLIHSMIAIATIATLVAVFGTTKKDLLNLAKKVGIGFLGIARRAGLGYLIYHSDSQKYFYCITKKSALEWLGSTYADAVMFSNWTKRQSPSFSVSNKLILREGIMVYLTVYTILHMYDVIPCQVYHFSSKEKAEAWAFKNGYKVVEYPDSDTECTIETVTIED